MIVVGASGVLPSSRVVRDVGRGRASGWMSFRTSIVCLPSHTKLTFAASASAPAMNTCVSPAALTACTAPRAMPLLFARIASTWSPVRVSASSTVRSACSGDHALWFCFITISTSPRATYGASVSS